MGMKNVPEGLRALRVAGTMRKQGEQGKYAVDSSEMEGYDGHRSKRRKE